MGALVVDPALLLAIAIVVVTIIIFVQLRRRGKRRRTVLITGLSDAGKTVMYSRLVTGTAVKTVTSMVENLCTGVVVDVEGRSTPITLVDIPGEDRVRKKCITKYLTSPNHFVVGVVCVIDSATFAKNSRDVAEMVYDLLIDSNRKIPVLIACNKQDSVQAKSENLIAQTLARELTLLNKTRFASLEMTDGSTKRRTLGIVGAEFNWDNDGRRVSFTSLHCAADAAGTDPLAAVRDWITAL